MTSVLPYVLLSIISNIHCSNAMQCCPGGTFPDDLNRENVAEPNIRDPPTFNEMDDSKKSITFTRPPQHGDTVIHYTLTHWAVPLTAYLIPPKSSDATAVEIDSKYISASTSPSIHSHIGSLSLNISTLSRWMHPLQHYELRISFGRGLGMIPSEPVTVQNGRVIDPRPLIDSGYDGDSSASSVHDGFLRAKESQSGPSRDRKYSALKHLLSEDPRVVHDSVQLLFDVAQHPREDVHRGEPHQLLRHLPLVFAAKNGPDLISLQCLGEAMWRDYGVPADYADIVRRCKLRVPRPIDTLGAVESVTDSAIGGSLAVISSATSDGDAVDWSNRTQTALFREIREHAIVHSNALHLVAGPSEEDGMRGNLTFHVVSSGNVQDLEWIVRIHVHPNSHPKSHRLDPQRIWVDGDHRDLVAFSVDDVLSTCFEVMEELHENSTPLQHERECRFAIGFSDRARFVPVLAPEMAVNIDLDHVELASSSRDTAWTQTLDHGHSAESVRSTKMKKAVSFEMPPRQFGPSSGHRSADLSGSTSPSFGSQDFHDFDANELLTEYLSRNISQGVIARALFDPDEPDPDHPVLVPPLDIPGVATPPRGDRESATSVTVSHSTDTSSSGNESVDGGYGGYGAAPNQTTAGIRVQAHHGKANAEETGMGPGSLFAVGGGMILVALIAAYYCCAKTESMVKHHTARIPRKLKSNKPSAISMVRK